jgi:hypothetical protein
MIGVLQREGQWQRSSGGVGECWPYDALRVEVQSPNGTFLAFVRKLEVSQLGRRAGMWNK